MNRLISLWSLTLTTLRNATSKERIKRTTTQQRRQNPKGSTHLHRLQDFLHLACIFCRLVWHSPVAAQKGQFTGSASTQAPPVSASSPALA
ncbi:unnamed protein product [Pseudo-nitzschia multistriata]|uniref:Secreted protein n=1 Tax=Pseudo-nitzschia multistriata TaxID=183589 RepID=A0A448ZDI6_9STRA|nr:unnamed protein product [Pseudo-nitzschia multistriata]